MTILLWQNISSIDCDYLIAEVITFSPLFIEDKKLSLSLTWGTLHATLALQNGVDIKTVSSMLGHYDAGFTLRTYTHATRQMQDQAAETMGNFMNQMMQPHPRATKTPGRKAKFVCQSLVTARSCLADTSTTARLLSESGRR